MQTWYLEGGKFGQAPEELEVFETVLAYGCSPDEARAFDAAVLELAAVLKRPPAEIDRWDADDRRMVLTVYHAQVEAEKERARRGK